MVSEAEPIWTIWADCPRTARSCELCDAGIGFRPPNYALEDALLVGQPRLDFGPCQDFGRVVAHVRCYEAYLRERGQPRLPHLGMTEERRSE